MPAAVTLLRDTRAAAVPISPRQDTIRVEAYTPMPAARPTATGATAAAIPGYRRYGGNHGGYGGYHGGYGGYHGGYGGYHGGVGGYHGYGGYHGGYHGYSTGAYWHGGYWHGGYWPRAYYGWGYAWFLPVLPLAYATYWYGGAPYYYANDVYYTWSPSYDGYVATDPPPVADPSGAAAAAAPDQSSGGAPQGYPADGGQVPTSGNSANYPPASYPPTGDPAARDNSSASSCTRRMDKARNSSRSTGASVSSGLPSRPGRAQRTVRTTSGRWWRALRGVGIARTSSGINSNTRGSIPARDVRRGVGPGGGLGRGRGDGEARACGVLHLSTDRHGCDAVGTGRAARG